MSLLNPSDNKAAMVVNDEEI